MNRLIFIFFSMLLSTNAYALSCHQHLNEGEPSTPDKLLCRDGYAVGFDYKHRVADWVAYHVTKESVVSHAKRTDDFHSDTDVPESYRISPDDYINSGYDRGHLAPAATMGFSHESMEQSFLMTNMSPQAPEFNRDGWRILEEKVRDWAKSRGELYVVDGPIWDGHEQAIGNCNCIDVPNSFYKIVYDPIKQQAIAFVIPNKAFNGSELPDDITTIHQVEALTHFHLDFFKKLPEDVQRKIKYERSELWK